MSNSDLHGRFVWHDLMTTEPEGAQEFYPHVVGWKTAPWYGGGEPYTMWVNGENPIGGVMVLPEEAREQGAQTHWLPYVGTPDVDETAERAWELGGTVLVEPTDIPAVGRFAVIRDPQGAIFAAYASANEPMTRSNEPQVGDFSWHELATTDYRAALNFYAELFGWKETEATDMGEMGTYQMYGLEDVTLGGMFTRPAEIPGPPAWLCYARVPDVHEAVERAKQRGGQLLNGPMEVPGGDWIAHCLDPQGGMFALHHHDGAAG